MGGGHLRLFLLCLRFPGVFFVLKGVFGGFVGSEISGLFGWRNGWREV